MEVVKWELSNNGSSEGSSTKILVNHLVFNIENRTDAKYIT
jgi:hypothetical protein